MNNTVNDSFAKGCITFITDTGVPARRFKLCTENYRTFNLYENQEEYQKAWERGEFTTLPVAFVRDNFGPVIVPKGHYMVLGDNRDASFDARFWGPLPDKYLKGQAFVNYWPLKRIKLIK